MHIRPVSALWICMSLLFSFAQAEQTPSTPVRVVVFDFGRVLGYSDQSIVDEKVSQALNIPPQDVHSIFLRLKKHLLTKGDERDFWEKYACSIGRTLPHNWLSEVRHIIASAERNVPGSLEIVQRLKKQGFQVALLSNVRKDKAEVLAQLGYYKEFQPVILSCDVDCVKPDAKIYKILLNTLKRTPEECLFIDDACVNVEAAQKMGMDAICFTSPEALIVELKKRGIFV